MGHMIELTADDGFRFPVYVAQPVAAPKAAIVLLQEIFGLNTHIRAVVDAYAVQGYVVLAPDMFHRVRPDVNMGYSADDVAAGIALKAAVEALPAPGVLQDIAATVRHAASLSSSGKVGVVGYCWGGLLTWRSACLISGVTAAVPYYGGGMTAPKEIERMPQCPVLAHFAENDKSIPLDGVAAFRQAHSEVAIHMYPATHGFNCDHRAAYDAPSAALALQRSLAFFAQHLLP
jgi:carboxymethylenebutenolidase